MAMPLGLEQITNRSDIEQLMAFLWTLSTPPHADEIGIVSEDIAVNTGQKRKRSEQIRPSQIEVHLFRFTMTRVCAFSLRT